MAGLGRKEWSPGDTLTAADVNGYLMDQSVMVFAGTAARASAIPTPSAGMVSYSTATGLQVYNGSTFTAVTKVLQVVQGTLSTTFSTTSTSYVTTGLTATITPTSTSSAVLVMYSGTQGAASGHDVFTTVYRGTTAGTNLGTTNGFVKVYSTAGGVTNSGASAIILDTPATTSAQVYTVAMKTSGGSGYWSNDATRSSITLMEISA